ncbi:hypothetical protein N1851_014455 [Merluccius polli]|uniref:THAP-type domain-containing protein n=1 Tax=Merluccius polli TaxID=89951 RepID=A0AA47P0U6_MERPO|nr:hypothetical protein N1851_014455 [Merluccius polli]
MAVIATQLPPEGSVVPDDPLTRHIVPQISPSVGREVGRHRSSAGWFGSERSRSARPVSSIAAPGFVAWRSRRLPGQVQRTCTAVPSNARASWVAVHQSRPSRPLHGFPKDKATLRQWVHFVRVRRAHFSTTSVTANTKICSAHFKEEDYDEEDARMVSLGLKTKRLAKLIPTTGPSAQHLSACRYHTEKAELLR